MFLTAQDLQASYYDDLNQIDEFIYVNKGLHDATALSGATNLTKLNLAFNSLNSCRSLELLTQLKVLNLSHNCVSNVKSLSGLVNLTSLNLSHNRISNVQPLQECKQLQSLLLQSNKLTSPEDLQCLTALSSLRDLVLKPNPVCQRLSDGYRAAFVASLPQIQALDAKRIDDVERSAATSSSIPSILSSTPKSAPASPTRRQRVHGARTKTKKSLDVDIYATVNDQEGVDQATGADGMPDHHLTQYGDESDESHQPSRHRRVSQTLPAAVESVKQPTNIQDAVGMLPDLSSRVPKPIPPPRRLTKRAAMPDRPAPEAGSLSIAWEARYGTGSRGRAVVVWSDGSAQAYWPGGSSAVNVSTRLFYSPGGEVRTEYSLLATYLNTGNVAVSFDDSGGFVQHPSGSIALVYNKESQTVSCYGERGEGLQKLDCTKQLPTSADSTVSMVLNEFLGVEFDAGSRCISVFFSCEGVQYRFIQGHNSAAADGNDLPASPDQVHCDGRHLRTSVAPGQGLFQQLRGKQAHQRQVKPQFVQQMDERPVDARMETVNVLASELAGLEGRLRDLLGRA